MSDNDARLVPPAGGVSDEEILDWTCSGVFKPGDAPSMEQVRAVLAWRGAQTEYDAQAIETLLKSEEEFCDLFPPDDWEPFDSYGDRVGFGERNDRNRVDSVDPSNKGDIADHARSVAGWKRAKSLRRLLAAVRSSRRARGRVVHGWAVFDSEGRGPAIYWSEDQADHASSFGFRTKRRCEVRILDAPEEGSK